MRVILKQRGNMTTRTPKRRRITASLRSISQDGTQIWERKDGPPLLIREAVSSFNPNVGDSATLIFVIGPTSGLWVIDEKTIRKRQRKRAGRPRVPKSQRRTTLRCGASESLARTVRGKAKAAGVSPTVWIEAVLERECGGEKAR